MKKITKQMIKDCGEQLFLSSAYERFSEKAFECLFDVFDAKTMAEYMGGNNEELNDMVTKAISEIMIAGLGESK